MSIQLFRSRKSCCFGCTTCLAWLFVTDRAQASEEAGNKWVYVKVKRKKSTYFLHIDLTETILEVKTKLQDLVQKVRSGDHKITRESLACFTMLSCHAAFPTSWQ